MKNKIMIQFKKGYIIIKLKESDTTEEIIQELKKKLPELKQFYQDEKTPILVTGKKLKPFEIDEIKALIQGLINVKVEFDIPKELGLANIKTNYRKEISNSVTQFYKKSIRSGQKIEFDGSVVILGDVNNGAEIVAKDNIIVLGALRGVAHAGANGNDEAIIAARIIDSLQIRISKTILEREQDDVKLQAYTFAYINEQGKLELE